MGIKQPALGVLDKLFITLMATIFIGVVLHAPLTVWLGTVFPSAELLIKAWKEVLMIVSGAVLVIILMRRRQLQLLKSVWVILPATYVLLHVIFIPFFITHFGAVLTGLLIDVRYIIYFTLAVLMVRLYPDTRRLFLWLFVVGASIVGIFSLLQILVLPPDFLKIIGYNAQTIQPFLTVDQNPEFVRINSTLRGPNPLGAFAVIGLAVAAAAILRGKLRSIPIHIKITVSIVIAGLLAALWFSYSRSAKIAAIAAIGLVILLTIGRKINRWVWVGVVAVVFALIGGVYAARETPFVSNVVLHENASTGSVVTSNDDHLASLVDGTERLVRQPFGAGIGSTGSASLQTDDPLIIENQYLYIAHEVGWLGLALFAVLFIAIIVELWRWRGDWLALAILASGIGLAFIGVLLPVWADDTVSIIWWGMAGIAIGGVYDRTIIKKAKRTA